MPVCSGDDRGNGAAIAAASGCQFALNRGSDAILLVFFYAAPIILA